MSIAGAVESLKIVGGCIVAAVLYGIVHDQFTARICVEYFTVFHPPIFATDSPTLLGIGWGIVATWWAGAIVGLLLVVAARFGSTPKFPAKKLVPWVVRLLAAMAFCAALFGSIGYMWAELPPDLTASVPTGIRRGFLADWWAHSASYASGTLRGLILSVVVWVKRSRTSVPQTAGE